MTVDQGASVLMEVLLAGERARPDHPVEFFDRDGEQDTRTLGELVDSARRLAASLTELGVGPGGRVAVHLPNGPEQFITQLAAVLLGAVFVPIVPVFGLADVAAILADARPTVYVTRRAWRSQDNLTDVVDALDPTLRPKHAIVSGLGDVQRDDLLRWEEMLDREPLMVQHEADPGDLCLVIYTSGSTGGPKGVRHTHASVLSEMLEPHYLAEPGQTQLQATGAGHIGGYLYPWRLLGLGNRIVVLDWWDTETALKKIVEHGLCLFAGTPFHLTTLLDAAERDGLDLSCLTRVIMGGAPIPPALIRRADAAGVVAVRAYGLSEQPTVTCGDFEDPLEVRATSDGRPTGGNLVRVLDEEGREVGPGVPGDIVTRGPDLCDGYTNAERAASFTGDGWLKTGDIGFLDEQGRLHLVDRKKNIIIRGGENLSIAEIEGVLVQHGDIDLAAVIGVPDPRYGERACAFVVPKPGRTVMLESLREHFAALGMARQKVPEFLEVVESLPFGGLQKVRRQELRDLYDRLHPVSVEHEAALR